MRISLLESEIQRIAAPIGGVFGVAALRVDGSGPTISVNGRERFPMASTYKVPIAASVLKKVDDGLLSLQTMLSVPNDKLVGTAFIAGNLIHPGISLSIHNLLELMITQSDNTATDVLIAAAGGGTEVTAWVREQRIHELRVDRTTLRILGDFFGFPEASASIMLAEAQKSDPDFAAALYRPRAAFDADPRDTTTPISMAQLLARIARGDALSDESTRTLVAIMGRCKTGADRIGGRMPPGTVVTHKTGTIGGTVNDVGWITLPDSAGQLIIAAYIKESAAPMAQREAVIADVARSIRDFYLFAACE